MAELAVITKRLDFHLEQVQDFTPTPMTVSTETWYTGYDPYTLEPVFSAKTPRDKLAQRQFFFWYKPEERRGIEQELRRIGRPDLIQQLYAGVSAPNQGRTSATTVVRNLSASNLNVTFSCVTRTVVDTTSHRLRVIALVNKARSVMVMASSAIVRAVNMVAEKAIMLVAIIVARLTAMVVVQ